MLGYFSAEWMFLAAIGLGTATFFADSAVVSIDFAVTRLAVALLGSLMF